MNEDRAANQRSAISLSFTLAPYISNGFGLDQLDLNQLSWLLRSGKFFDPENSFVIECVGKNKILTSNSKSA